MNQFLGGKRFIINLFSDHSKNDDGAIDLNSRGYSGAVLPFKFHNNLICNIVQRYNFCDLQKAPFQFQQRDFVVNAPTVTREVAVGTHHTMARYDETDGVPSHCATYSLRRIDFQPFCDFSIGHGFPERYLSYDIQHRLAEWRQVFHAVDWCEIRLTAREIDVQPMIGVMDYGR